VRGAAPQGAPSFAIEPALADEVYKFRLNLTFS
jgi:hypothetical protein